jgi:hypothetical protein
LKTSLLNGGSFLKRIHGNLRSVWRLPWAPVPSAGAPIHLLDERRARTAPAAHVGSALVHGVLFALILALALWAPKRREIDPFTVLPGRSIEYWSNHASHAKGPDGGGKAGGGGITIYCRRRQEHSRRFREFSWRRPAYRMDAFIRFPSLPRYSTRMRQLSWLR